MKSILPLLGLTMLLCLGASAQNYTNYPIGSTTDLLTSPKGGICLMGGATESDDAMRWFLQQANGGDVLVLRASGSDGYNNYLYSDLGVGVNSVETIVFNNAGAANESYIHQKIQQAEAIWFAGGDQWDYISFWRNTAIDNLIRDGIQNRHMVVGGTSAGMAIQGGFYFSAQNGTITSESALANPFDANLTVDSIKFIASTFMANVITDTHYDNPNRKGRHVAFLARIFTDYGINAKGIACDEYTAVCVDTSGMAMVFGDHPSYDDNAYFIQTNCELNSIAPEDCSVGNPLDWNLGNEALKVYAVKGTTSGSNTFDLNDWKTGTGGTWEHWYVDNGVLHQVPGSAPNCDNTAIVATTHSKDFIIFPNPAQDYVHLRFNFSNKELAAIQIRNAIGQTIKVISTMRNQTVLINTANWNPGMYLVKVRMKDGKILTQRLLIN